LQEEWTEPQPTFLPVELAASASKCDDCESRFVRGDQLALHVVEGHGGWKKKKKDKDDEDAALLPCYWCKEETFEGEKEREAHFQDKHKDDARV
jgi:hypothetical protein